MANCESRQLQFEECVDRFSDSMYRVAFRLTASADSAEELVQESYVQAWKNLSSLRDATKMRSWLFAILRNQYLKWVRSEKRMPVAIGDGVEQVQEKARKEMSSSNETIDAVQRAVQQLEDNFRLPLLLVAMEQLPVDEAAEILDLPRGTVLSRLHRARKKLKDILAREMKEFEF